jgi:hypothetical protein
MMRRVHALSLTTLVGCFDPATGGATDTATDTDASTGSPSTSATSPTGSSTTETTMMSSSTTMEETTEDSSSSSEGSESGSSSSDSSSSSSGEVTFAHTIYLNFDGVVLTEEPQDDATNDQVNNAMLATTFEPFGDSPQPAAILALVQEDFAPYDVLVTDERPAGGSYTMAVISPTNPIGAGLITLATEVDCGNANENNVVFLFAGAKTGFTNQEMANFASSVLGHSYGLDNGAVGTGDLMENSIISDDLDFVDFCLDLGAPPGVCSEQHAAQCGPTGQQNTHAELLLLLGENPT